ncbi:MAG: S41 family peptidase [Candidatus Acidiferrales bacterium]
MRACTSGLLFILAGLLSCSTSAREMTTERWREDLRYLASELPKRHAAFFARVSRDEFEQAVNRLDQRLPSLSNHEIIVELARLVAMAEDGHTELAAPQAAAGFRRYPIGFFVFGKDFYAVSGEKQYSKAIGLRLVRIGKVPIDTAFERVKPLLAHDNEMEFLHAAPEYLAHPEVLHALGIIDSLDRGSFTFETADGRELTVDLQAVPRPNLRVENWLNVTELSGHSLPLYRRNPRESYWYEYLSDSKTLYFQYNRCADQAGKPALKRVVKELLDFADSHPVERLVIDLRHNSGGNFHLSAPLVEGIRERPNLARPGRLFVITGRRTFSAGMVTALLLKKQTPAVLVGEPSRGRPTYNAEELRLPNSGLVVQYTEKLHTPAPELANSEFLAVDLAVAATFADYKSGRDPVLDTILAYPTSTSVKSER